MLQIYLINNTLNNKLKTLGDYIQSDYRCFILIIIIVKIRGQCEESTTFRHMHYRRLRLYLWSQGINCLV